MLISISITGEATFPNDGVELSELKKVNFLFGHNGCGKTTISRAISDPAARDGYSVGWANARPIAALVYNRDFAENNFGEQLKGIFTLGEDSTKNAEEIERLQGEIGKLDREIDGLIRNLEGDDASGGRRQELRDARVQLEEACWTSQQTHKGAFEEAMAGHRQSKAAFCDKLIAEAENNASELVHLDTLKSHAETTFRTDATEQAPIAPIDFSGFQDMENAPILERRIVGRDDVIVAKLIEQLGNSDWVKQGVQYIEPANGRCPFCQQSAPADLRDNLDAFFDRQYENDLSAISALADQYAAAANNVEERVQGLLAETSRFVDNDVLAERHAALRRAYDLNIERLDAKRRNPSEAVQIENTLGVGNALAEIVAQANEAIQSHNELVRDLAASRTTLRSQVWRFIIEERKTDLSTYETTTGTISKAIEGLEQSLASKRQTRAEFDTRLKELEAKATSVQPTVDAINSILTSFGFTSFKLSVAGERGDMYRIVRSDGSDARSTLSEGERSFVTFLYFYHMLSGSTSGTGTTEEKVVVFDDPVSSLDADVLFVVSSLIRNVIKDVRDGNGSARQVFVLTHNIYFHKEVSFDRSRATDNCRRDETFWVVRKREGISSVQSYGFNPVKTSYEMLWEEVRADDRSKLTIQNTLRRIIENYLIVLGGLKQDEIVAKFEGREAQICASLFSWTHDGSHTAHDEIYLAADGNAVQGYLRVFRQIFEKTGHLAHFNMMMKLPSGDVPKASPEPVGE
ncbi:AAA family ATPase (plasmid) [Erythrobacteraceae bacterium WH01K]|nr:AAA family ATPase [Erythrobacteraceae bacterium WH01K]